MCALTLKLSFYRSSFCKNSSSVHQFSKDLLSTLGYLGSPCIQGFWLGWFYVVNGGFVVGVQGTRWEGLVGWKACDLGSIGMIMWVVVLHWVRVCDYSC